MHHTTHPATHINTLTHTIQILTRRAASILFLVWKGTLVSLPEEQTQLQSFFLPLSHLR
jgi:hypothetical protein